MKARKIFILLLSVLILGMLVIVIRNIELQQKNNNNNLEESITGELPIEVDEIPIEFSVINENDENIIEMQYKNNSGYDISNLTIEVRRKDNEQVIELRCGNKVEVGKESEKFYIDAPEGITEENIEIIKYKISLTKGIYVEYDVVTNQYNWS